jgi:hypothetical protein
VIRSMFKLSMFLHSVNRDGVETLGDICLRVEEPAVHGSLKSLLPQYSCFIVSPANLWHKDFKRLVLSRNCILCCCCFCFCWETQKYFNIIKSDILCLFTYKFIVMEFQFSLNKWT